MVHNLCSFMCQNVNRFITVLFRSFIEIIVYKQVCHGCLCSLTSRDWNVNKCTLLCWRNAQLSYNGVVANIISNLSIKYIVHVNARPCISQVLYPEQLQGLAQTWTLWCSITVHTQRDTQRQQARFPWSDGPWPVPAVLQHLPGTTESCLQTRENQR